MNTDAYLRWLECECDACKILASIAHDKLEWNAQLEQCKAHCPNWSPDIYEDAAPSEDQP